jgi:glycosyltransferase involved in cell wall biosynthesis
LNIAVATTNANGDGKLDVSTSEPVVFESCYSVRYYDETIIGRFSWDFTRHLWRDISSSQLVHLQDVFSTYAAWTLVLAWLARKPILISPRGTFAQWGLRTKRPWLKKLWLLLFVKPFVADVKRAAWHATSDVEREEIQRQFPEAPVFVVPNGMDCAVFESVAAPTRRDYLAFFFPKTDVRPERATVLVGLGRLHVQKCFDVVIRALHILRTAGAEAVLLIAGGDDGEGEALTRLIKRLGLGSCVTLVGEVHGEEKLRFLKGADLFVFPSFSENFGMVVLEALAAGLPVVASRNTPWAELETEGTGLWVENTPEAFVEAIANLLARDRATLSSHSREHAMQFDIGAVATRLEGIYAKLIAAANT